MTSAAPPHSEEPTLYERLGGEPGLRAIVEDFVGRVTSDMMIGFFFRTVDKKRLVELELQFASRHLGGPKQYNGRPLNEAHKKHPIMGGQFNRRLRLLEQTLKDHAVPEEVRRAWLDHNERLRSQITRDRSDECNDPLSAENLRSGAPRDKTK